MIVAASSLRPLGLLNLRPLLQMGVWMDGCRMLVTPKRVVRSVVGKTAHICSTWSPSAGLLQGKRCRQQMHRTREGRGDVGLQVCTEFMGLLISHSAHKHPGTLDHLLNTEALLALSWGQACAHLDRFQCQPSEWDQIAAVPKGGPQAVDLGKFPFRHHESHAPLGGEELHGGLPVQPETTPRRVGIVSSGGTKDLVSVLQGPGGSFCLTVTKHCSVWFSSAVASPLLGMDALANIWPLIPQILHTLC